MLILNLLMRIKHYITVDGCIYPRGHHDLCCDYALNFDNITIFVELKGSDIAHAIKQILATKQDAKFTINPGKIAVVVSSKTPKDDQSLRLQKIHLRKQGVTLLHGNSPLLKELVNF